METTDESILWSLIDSRDRAFARAHEAVRAWTRAAGEKDAEIARLKAAADEKEAEIGRLKRSAEEKDAEIGRLGEASARLRRAAEEKEAEIGLLHRAASERLSALEGLLASPEYRAGAFVLHPWRRLRGKG
jgi:chromosome segregation ATPase